MKLPLLLGTLFTLCLYAGFYLGFNYNKEQLKAAKNTAEYYVLMQILNEAIIKGLETDLEACP